MVESVQGDKTILSCLGAPFLEPVIWEDGQKNILNNNNSLFLYSNKLIINITEKKHEGFYKCAFDANETTIWSDSTYLKVYGKHLES